MTTHEAASTAAAGTVSSPGARSDGLRYGALFGPVKYGILPDHLKTDELASANALVEGATFLAILSGTIAGGALVAGSGNRWTIAALIMTMAVACWVTARLIPPTGAGSPELPITRWISASTRVSSESPKVMSSGPTLFTANGVPASASG